MQLEHDDFMKRVGVEFSNDSVITAARVKERLRAGRAIHPGSLGRQVWDVIILTLVVYTAIVIPYQYAFNQRLTLSWWIVGIAVDLFFVVDVVVNFLTAFTQGRQYVLCRNAASNEIANFGRDSMVTDFRSIAWHYLGHWFAVDVVACMYSAASRGAVPRPNRPRPQAFLLTSLLC